MSETETLLENQYGNGKERIHRVRNWFGKYREWFEVDDSVRSQNLSKDFTGEWVEVRCSKQLDFFEVDETPIPHLTMETAVMWVSEVKPKVKRERKNNFVHRRTFETMEKGRECQRNWRSGLLTDSGPMKNW